MNWGWEPGNDKQGFVVCISVSRNNGEITRKEMSAFFFQNITTTMVGWNVAEQMDTGFSTGKHYGFWVLWGIFKE